MRWSPSTSAERAMPEMIEVELYRQVAELAVGHVVEAVDAPDPWYLKRGTTAEELAAALVGATITGTRRIGKLLLLDTDAHVLRSEEHTSELQSLMRTSYAVFCL